MKNFPFKSWLHSQACFMTVWVSDMCWKRGAYSNADSMSINIRSLNVKLDLIIWNIFHESRCFSAWLHENVIQKYRNIKNIKIQCTGLLILSFQAMYNIFIISLQQLKTYPIWFSPNLCTFSYHHYTRVTVPSSWFSEKYIPEDLCVSLSR